MPINDLSSELQYAVDLLAIFAFALSGAFMAVRKDFDVFGTVILSEAAGLGGGLFRDLVLGVVPVAFSDLGYFFTPIAAAAVVYFGHRLSIDHKVRDNKLLDVSDAAALGLFSVTGTIKALEHGFSVPAAATLGTASAVGGGVLASLVALEVPSLLRWNHDLYALPAFVGACTTAALHVGGLLSTTTVLGAAGFAVFLRLLALRYGWRTPRSQFWRNPFAGLRHQPVPPRTVCSAQAEQTPFPPHRTPLLDGPATPAAAPAALEEDTVAIRRPEADTVTFRQVEAADLVEPHATDPRIALMRLTAEDRSTDRGSRSSTPDRRPHNRLEAVPAPRPSKPVRSGELGAAPGGAPVGGAAGGPGLPGPLRSVSGLPPGRRHPA
jgi:uncharacterized membrane protein YeiH